MYEPTWDSVSTHPVPQWYDDAKLGIFLHWGLYSVPGWAPQVPDIQQMLRTQGPEVMLRNNPYAEWYRNSMQIDGSPTQVHHDQTYGKDFPYDGFRGDFEAGSSAADLDALAQLCSDGGARYVVLTTKHHEGYTLWPASTPHPAKGHYHPPRDLVGDLAAAVRGAGMRMGLYYSGGYDWPFNDAVLKNPADSALAIPTGPEYLDYATGHVKELIDRYAPDVLWNDIAWPGGGNLADLFAYYYNAVPDGALNDRWIEGPLRHNAVQEAFAHGVGTVIQKLWRFVPEDSKSLTFPAAHHYDFRTPEYATFDKIVEKKWEATRGVGHSFGANRNERPEDIVTVTELVRSFVDIVAKNGNLLIGIGPGPDGVIPDEQRVPVRGLGDWLAVNGEAIYGTRPWKVPAATTDQGAPIRFTQSDGHVYAILIDEPGVQRLSIRGVGEATPGSVTTVRMLGLDTPLPAAVESGSTLTIDLPADLPVAPAWAFDLGPGVLPAF